MIDRDVDGVLKEVCLRIEKLKFLEIGTDSDHVHFLVQSVPTYNITKIMTMLKRITAKEVFRECHASEKEAMGWEILD